MKKKHRVSDESIYDAISDAIRQAGWSIPTDEASVAAAEERLESDTPELPANLRDPKLPPAAGNMPVANVISLWDPAVLAGPMARAAREGGSVPPEIEKIMERDRKIAEYELRNRNRDSEEDDS